MVDYVVNLRKINNKVQIKPPKANIEDVIEDPTQYARDYVEIALAKYVKEFKKAFRSGQDLAKELEREN